MNSKSDSRIRRAAKTRTRISQQDKPRLSVFKASQNLYAQVFDSTGSNVLASASTNEKEDKMPSNEPSCANNKGVVPALIGACTSKTLHTSKHMSCRKL